MGYQQQAQRMKQREAEMENQRVLAEQKSLPRRQEAWEKQNQLRQTWGRDSEQQQQRKSFNRKSGAKSAAVRRSMSPSVGRSGASRARGSSAMGRGSSMGRSTGAPTIQISSKKASTMGKNSKPSRNKTRAQSSPRSPKSSAAKQRRSNSNSRSPSGLKQQQRASQPSQSRSSQQRGSKVSDFYNSIKRSLTNGRSSSVNDSK